jgi:putative endonuclease
MTALPYCVYVLISETDGNLYTGFTADLPRRLGEHNAGQSLATAPRRPFRLLFCEYHGSKSDALKREIYLKTSAGNRLSLATLRSKPAPLSPASGNDRRSVGDQSPVWSRDTDGIREKHGLLRRVQANGSLRPSTGPTLNRLHLVESLGRAMLLQPRLPVPVLGARLLDRPVSVSPFTTRSAPAIRRTGSCRWPRPSSRFRF